jgi:hypothetical protein
MRSGSGGQPWNLIASYLVEGYTSRKVIFAIRMAKAKHSDVPSKTTRARFVRAAAASKKNSAEAVRTGVG